MHLARGHDGGLLRVLPSRRGVRRGGVLFAPEPGDQLFVGDDIYIVCHRDDTERALDIFGKPFKRQERMVIVGGGNVGLAVAQKLESASQRVRTKMIEKNRRCAERAADGLFPLFVTGLVLYGVTSCGWKPASLPGIADMLAASAALRRDLLAARGTFFKLKSHLSTRQVSIVLAFSLP